MHVKNVHFDMCCCQSIQYGFHRHKQNSSDITLLPASTIDIFGAYCTANCGFYLFVVVTEIKSH